MIVSPERCGGTHPQGRVQICIVWRGVNMKIKCAFGIHKWEGCRCKVCRETRDQDHQWNATGCRCLRCYRENHEWILSGTDIENEYQDGYFLNGSGQCESEYEIIKHYNI